MTRRVVVIGAGQAGFSLVDRLRAESHEGSITLLGAEPHLPYERPPLTKAFLLGELPREALRLRPEGFYADRSIDLGLGTPVAAVDTRRQAVILETGGEIKYNDLVFATGALPRRLPVGIGGNLAGVYTIRNLEDAEALAGELVPGRRTLVVGGGYIGLEVAAVAATRGLDVTLIEMAPRILQRVAAAETADLFRDLHRGHGVDVREATSLERLEGEKGRVSAARLATGEKFPVDMVIVGIGIEPNVGIAQAAGIAIENGIRTDEMGRTSVPNVWAAGDCASLPYAGGRIRLESVGNAIDQAEAVARNILGAGKPYRPAPWFWSDQYEAKLQIAGLGAGNDRIVVRQVGERISHWYFRNGGLVAVYAKNDSDAYLVGKRLIEAGKSPDAKWIADPTAKLKALLRT